MSARHVIGAGPLRAGVADAAVGAAILLAVGALYGAGLHYPLVFDDDYWFSPQNMQVLAEAHVTSRYLSKALTYLSFKWFHGDIASLRLISLLLHGCAAFAVFVFCRRLVAMVAPGDDVRRDTTTAAAAALIFACHPVQVYAIAYLGQQEIILATLFSVVSLLAFLEGLRRRQAAWYLASVAFYAGAVLSKENLIMIPALAAAMTLLVERPNRDRARMLVLPFGLFAVVALGIVIVIATQPAAIPTTGFEQTQLALSAIGDATDRAIFLRSVVMQGAMFFRYLLLWFIPDPAWMSIDLQVPLVPRLAAGPQIVGFVAFCLWPIAATSLLLRRGWSGLVGFGLLWPWLLFATELATTRSLDVFVLYRSYPWIIGPCLVAACILVRSFGRVAAAPVVLVIGMLGLIAHDRLATFATPVRLWDDAVQKNRAVEGTAAGAFRPYINRGEALLAAGQFDGALEDFRAALRLKPDLPEAHFDAAVADIGERRYQLALDEMNVGLLQGGRLHPSILARAYGNRAAVFLFLDRPADALADLDTAIRLDPNRADYRSSRDQLRARMEHTGRAPDHP